METGIDLSSTMLQMSLIEKTSLQFEQKTILMANTWVVPFPLIYQTNIEHAWEKTAR